MSARSVGGLLFTVLIAQAAGVHVVASPPALVDPDGHALQ